MLPNLYIVQSAKCFLRDMAGDRLYDTYGATGTALVANDPYCTQTQSNLGHLEVGVATALFLVFPIVALMVRRHIRNSGHAWDTWYEGDQYLIMFVAVIAGVFGGLLIPLGAAVVALNIGVVTKTVALVSGLGYVAYRWFRFLVTGSVPNPFSALKTWVGIDRRLKKKEKELQLLEAYMTEMKKDPYYTQALELINREIPND